MMLTIFAVLVAVSLICMGKYLPKLRDEMWQNMAKEIGIDDIEFVKFLYGNFGKITKYENTKELGSDFFTLKMDSLIEKGILKKEDGFLVAPPQIINDIVKKGGFEMPTGAISICVMNPQGKPKHTELYYNVTLSKDYGFTKIFKIPNPSVEGNMFYKKTSR